jgi:hypothetical protein
MVETPFGLNLRARARWSILSRRCTIGCAVPLHSGAGDGLSMLADAKFPPALLGDTQAERTRSEDT